MDRNNARLNNRRQEELKVTSEFLAIVFDQVSKKLAKDVPPVLELLKNTLSPAALKVEQIVDSIVETTGNVAVITDLVTTRLKQEIANYTAFQTVVNTTAIVGIKASRIFIGGNYAIFAGNSLIKMSRLLRKFNLRDPLFILQFAREMVVLLSHSYSVLAHVDSIYETKPTYRKSSFLWDIFIFTIQFSFDPGLRIAYRNVFSGGGIFAPQALARAVQLGLPDHMRDLFMIPFSLLKSGMGKFRQPKSLIISGPLSIPKVSLVLKEKTNKIFFSRLKKIAQNVRPTLTESIKDNFSYMLNKKNKVNPIAIFAVQNYKIPLPSLKVDFVHFMIKNYKTIHVKFPLAKVAPIIKDVVVQPITSYKLRLVSPVAKFQTFKSYLNPFTLTWF